MRVPTMQGHLSMLSLVLVTTSDLLIDISIPLAVASLWLGLSRSTLRLISGPGKLHASLSALTLYGFWFVLGMGYIFAFASEIHLTAAWRVFVVTVWACFLIGVGIFRQRRVARSVTPEHNGEAEHRK